MYRALCLGVVLVLLGGCDGDPHQIRTYALGEKVQTGTLVYEAFETHWSLALGNPDNPRAPSKHFLLLRLVVTNEGATNASVPTMMLVGDNGQTTNELTDGTDVPEWLGVDRRLQPTQSIKGNVAFDAQPRHYKLRVADETDQIVAYIDLPLTFNPDDKNP